MALKRPVSYRWQINSLFQLVVIAFVVVLLPLATLFLQGTRALEDISHKGYATAKDIARLAKSSQSMPGLVLDMERSARQFQVVGDPKLLAVFEVTRERFMRDFELVCDLPGKSTLRASCSTLESTLKSLVGILHTAAPDSIAYADAIASFNKLSFDTRRLVKQLNDLVEQYAEDLAAEASAVKTSLLWQGTLLVPISMALCIIFIVLITRPIRRLEYIIQQIGTGSGVSEDDLHVGGPLELSKLATKLDWLQRQLKALEEQKLSFVRQMSHELKTPLASLREGADLLAEQVPGTLNHNQQEIVTILQEKGRQLQRLIENLIDFNGLKYKKQLQCKELDIAPLVLDIVQEYQLDLQRTGVRYCLGGPALKITVDPDEFRLILSNLVSNAIYYSTAPWRMWIRWEQDEQATRIQVANTGPAIDDEARERIFEPFEQGQSKRAGNLKGSGIGLAVAKECARHHGGDLRVGACDGADACFELYLPRALNLDHNRTSTTEQVIHG